MLSWRAHQLFAAALNPYPICDTVSIVNPSAVIFDLDGTLIDSGSCAVRAARFAFADFGCREISADEILANMGIPIEVLFPKLIDRTDFDYEALYTRFREIYAELSERMISPFPSILELIDNLISAEINLAIVTSKKTTTAVSNCRTAGIKIDLIIGSDQVRYPKPHPEGVLRAAKSLSLSDSLHSAIVVGDAAVDIQMGKEAGALTCAALWGAHSTESLLLARPDLTAKHPLELLDHIELSDNFHLAVTDSF